MYYHFCIVFFSGNQPGENFFITHPPAHSQTCIKIYIFNFEKHQPNKQKKTRTKKSKRNYRRKANISGNVIKNNKSAAAQVKIFLATHISGNKSNFLLIPYWIILTFLWQILHLALLLKLALPNHSLKLGSYNQSFEKLLLLALF